MENSEMRVGAVTNVKEAKILKMPLPEIHDDEVLVRIHVLYVLLNKEYLRVKRKFLYQMWVDMKLPVALLE